MSRKLVAAAGLALLAACQDGPVDPSLAPGSGGPSAAGEAAAPQGDARVLPLFNVDLRLTGSTRPGTPVGIEVRVEAALPARDAEIIVRVPELSALQKHGRGREFRLPTADAPAPAAAAWRAGLAAHAPRSYRTSVVFPAPGYYQVHVSVQGTPAAPADRDVQPVSHRQLWVWVDKTGGRITESFDTSLFPAGAVKTPGPLRFLADLAPTGPPARGRGTAEEGGVTAQNTCMINGIFFCDAYLYAMYYDQDAGYYRGLPNAMVTTEYWDRDPYTGQGIFVDSRLAQTDAQGRYHIDCTLWSYYTDQVVVLGSVETTTGDVTVERGSSGTAYGVTFNHGRVADVCEHAAHGYEGLWDVNLAGNQARVFDNMTYSIANSRLLMGYTRGHVKARVYDTGDEGYYNRSSDFIRMDYQTIWGNYGRAVAAHEYGHALHEKGLAGNRGGGCPDPHFLRVASNLSCAFSEGFANFHSAMTIGMRMNAAVWNYGEWSLQAAETNWKSASGGATTESKVGAFFLDLADGAGSPDNVAGDDDAAAYGAGYVGKAIRECTVTWREDTSQLNQDGMVQQFTQRANDLLDLVHCFEGQISPSGRLSIASLDSQGNIITLNAVSATALTQASGWSRASVQAIWSANIAN